MRRNLIQAYLNATEHKLLPDGWSSTECAEQGSPVTAAVAMIIFFCRLILFVNKVPVHGNG